MDELSQLISDRNISRPVLPTSALECSAQNAEGRRCLMLFWWLSFTNAEVGLDLAIFWTIRDKHLTSSF